MSKLGHQPTMENCLCFFLCIDGTIYSIDLFLFYGVLNDFLVKVIDLVFFQFKVVFSVFQFDFKVANVFPILDVDW